MAFLKEVGKLRDLGVEMIASSSSPIAPGHPAYHRMIELAARSARPQKIGTTSRGIGPPMKTRWPATASASSTCSSHLPQDDIQKPVRENHRARTLRHEPLDPAQMYEEYAGRRTDRALRHRYADATEQKPSATAKA